MLPEPIQNLATLMQICQACSHAAQYLLILAGTPNLYDKLDSLSATFWERCQPIAGIGRLDSGASAAAVERPLAAQGIGFTPEALAALVAESQRYPYFLQLCGKALWDQVRSAAGQTGKSGIERIDATVFAAARPEFERSKNGFYAVRYRQLEQSELLPAARTVALAFVDWEVPNRYKKGAPGRLPRPGRPTLNARRRAIRNPAGGCKRALSWQSCRLAR